MPASGTVTVAVVGIPAFWLLSRQSITVQIAVAVVFTLASIWLHHVGDKLLGEKDSRKLVWDEIAGFLVAIIAVPFTWQLALAAFLIERALDIAKVPPANWIEKKWPGGLGVAGDDIVAGLYTLAALHALIRFAPSLMGV